MDQSELILEGYHEGYANVSGQSSTIVPEKGRGVWIITPEGEEYLDFGAGYRVHQLGYQEHVYARYIQILSHHLLHSSMPGLDFNAWPHSLGVRLIQRLRSIVPIKDSKVFFCNSGTEAVEGAIKISPERNNSRPYIFSFEGAFHGRTLASLSLTHGQSVYHEGYPRFPHCLSVPFPCDQKSFDAMRYLLEEGGWHVSPDHINKIFVEFVQGEGGMRQALPEAMRWLRDFCSEYEIILVDDEVQAGLGSTGKMFACEHYGVIPDVMLLAKGFGLGIIPFGTVVFRRDLDWEKPGQHSNTMGGTKSQCIAALLLFDLFEEQQVVRNAAERGEDVRIHLESLQKAFSEFITGVHGLGLMQGIDCVTSEVRDAVVARTLKEKLILIKASERTIRITPPLIISKEEIALGMERIRKAFASIPKP